MEWLYFVILGIAVQSASGNFSGKCCQYIYDKVSEFTAKRGMLPV